MKKLDDNMRKIHEIFKIEYLVINPLLLLGLALNVSMMEYNIGPHITISAFDEGKALLLQSRNLLLNVLLVSSWMVM
jgi:hypothetical protein